MMTGKKNVVREKSFAFAIQVVKVYKHLADIKNEYVMSKQLLRSGTAIGAMVREAEQAESKPDFIHKLAIALKETNETCYWLELLYRTQYIAETPYLEIEKKATELLKLLISIIKTSKANIN